MEHLDFLLACGRYVVICHDGGQDYIVDDFSDRQAANFYVEFGLGMGTLSAHCRYEVFPGESENGPTDDDLALDLERRLRILESIP